MANKFNFDRVKVNMQRLKTELPVILANDAQKFFVDSWRQQGWEGKDWPEVKRRIPGTREYKFPKTKGLGRRTRAILVKSGALRRAVGHSIRSKTFNNIRLVVDLPYAARHNEGLEGMPRRTFMRDSPVLKALQRKKINQAIDKTFKA